MENHTHKTHVTTNPHTPKHDSYTTMPNFDIQPCGQISSLFLSQSIDTFHDAIGWVHQLPYGRNTNRSDFRLVIVEKKGTCSTKHAALAALANEHHQPVQLKMVICKIDSSSNNQIDNFLNQLGTDYFPEAHCILGCHNGHLDITFAHETTQPELTILTTHIIKPNQIGDHKQTLHRDYLIKWMDRKNLSKQYHFDQIWKWREEWIQCLSNH